MTFQKAIHNFPINTCSANLNFLRLSFSHLAAIPLSLPLSLCLSPTKAFCVCCHLSLWAFPNLSYLGLQLSSFPRWRSQFFTFQSLALNWELKLCESRLNLWLCRCLHGCTMATQLASSTPPPRGGGAASEERTCACTRLWQVNRRGWKSKKKSHNVAGVRQVLGCHCKRRCGVVWCVACLLACRFPTRINHPHNSWMRVQISTCLGGEKSHAQTFLFLATSPLTLSLSLPYTYFYFPIQCMYTHTQTHLFHVTSKQAHTLSQEQAQGTCSNTHSLYYSLTPHKTDIHPLSLCEPIVWIRRRCRRRHRHWGIFSSLGEEVGEGI